MQQTPVVRRLVSMAAITVVVTVAVARSEPIRATYRAELASAISEHVERNLSDLFAYYKDLHAQPELSLHEGETARKIAERLRLLGYAVTTGVGGHGVVGVLRNGAGPTVLVRGDMDALPITEETGLPYRSQVRVTNESGRKVGVMHACGHDIHQTCLLGTAGVLSQLRDHWSGTIVAIAQPAEEIGKGARLMIEDGLFERFPRPDYCLALHVAAAAPTGSIGYTGGWALANVDSVDITIFGRGGHGSRPNEAIDPIAAAAQVIVSLQTIVSRRVDPREPAVITVGSIHAGSKHNIIPDEAKLKLTIRSYTEETRRILLDGIREITLGTCRAMGCTKDPLVTLREDEFTPAAYNDPALTQAAVEVLRQTLGSDRVVERKPVMGGEDFGRFSRHLKAPGFIFWLGAVNTKVFEDAQQSGDPLPSLHSSKFAPDPEPTIATGVKAMASIVLALLDPKP